MKLYLILFLVILLPSCSEDTLSDRLVGSYQIEKEFAIDGVLQEFSSGVGSLNLNEDGSGIMVFPFTSSLALDVEWDLQRQDTKFALTQYFSFDGNEQAVTKVYDILERENDFVLTSILKFNVLESDSTFSERIQFEQIILNPVE